MTIELQTVKASLYEADFTAWIDATAAHLRARNFAEVDWENLLEEIDAMGRRERKSLKSNLVIVLLHLLKWQHQREMRCGSWQGSIVEHRQRLRDDLQDSPSLKPYLPEILAPAYADARERAAAETGLALAQFPRNCEYTIDQILDREFLPE
jgi:Domain of unknown function DUF29